MKKRLIEKNNSLFKNKKGLAIIDVIGNAIQTLTNILPKPILFLLFLFILVIGAWFLSLIFNVFGIYCNSANVPMQLHSNIINNFDLINDVPDPKNLNLNVITNPDSVQKTVTFCSYYVENGTFKGSDGTTTLITQRYLYKDDGCIQCQNTGRLTAQTAQPDLFGFIPLPNTEINTNACADLIISGKDEKDKSFLQKISCGEEGLTGRCEPPKHYQYNSNKNFYECADNTCESKTIGTMWDEKLSKAGATSYYTTTTSRNPSSDNFIGVTCVDLRPRLAIYGADLFNYKMWILLTVLLIVFWLWSSF